MRLISLLVDWTRLQGLKRTFVTGPLDVEVSLNLFVENIIIYVTMRIFIKVQIIKL